MSLRAHIPDRRTRLAMGSAMAFVLASRLVGVAREALVVAVIGVHDFTDSYFALSSVTLWFQNWSFGALALYLVPRIISMGGERRRRWIGARKREAWIIGACVGAVFVLTVPWLEPALLHGRSAMPPGGIAALAACIPLYAVNGVLLASVTSSAGGIVQGARAEFLGNAAGTLALGTTLFGLVPAPVIMPLSLLIAQATLWCALGAVERQAVSPVDNGGSAPASSVGQFAAATAENVGVNLNNIAQQALIGQLAPGTITLNAYVSRLVLVPLVGLLQPVQQRLLVLFSGSDPGVAGARAKLVAGTAIVASCAIGVLLGGVCYVAYPFFPEQVQALASASTTATLVAGYAGYAGVVFANQAYARFFFAVGTGWRYASAMLAAYWCGIVMKAYCIPRLGVASAPLLSVLAEGCALLAFSIALSVRTARSVSQVTP